jgi:hypothetical protein
LVAAFGLALVACTANPVAVADATPVAPAPATPSTPIPDVVTGPTDDPDDAAGPGSPHEGHGDVEPSTPELSIEIEDGYVVSVTDPAAKAWRIAVTGTGTRAGHRLEVIVEVGDIAPGAEVRFELDGQLLDVLELGSMIGADTAASGGCHPTLGVCVSSADIDIDGESGTLTVRFEMLGDGPISIEGATAGWPEEPFVLGPWDTTEPFVGE